MDIVWAIVSVLLAIMILVFVHEMGHFLFAKLFKMRVDRFSIGFPPKIVGKQVGETEYVIGATPLGGYVKIAGMVDESMDTDNLESEPEPWEFRAKPVWQRIIVITAGVIFNVVLACLIFIGLKYVYGEAQPLATEDGSVYVADSSLAYQIGLRTGDRILGISGKPFEPYGGAKSIDALLADPLTIDVNRGGQELTLQGPDDIMTQLGRLGGLGLSFEPSVIGRVVGDTPAEEAGLQAGDRIIAINNEPVVFWEEMSSLIRASAGEPISIRWMRPESYDEEDATVATTGEILESEIQPAHNEAGDYYFIGVDIAVRFSDYSMGEAIVAGVVDTWLQTKGTAISLKRIFTGRENLRENLGGPVMVAKITGQAAQAGGRAFWNIVALLSITLAIVNILPIPALDGGHLVFLIYEGITRREPSLKVRMAMQQVGMVLLLTLMAFLIFNDILRL